MKIIFLDRDGVINRYPGDDNYVTKVKDFHFIPGSLQAIVKLTEAGYKIFVISNQAGVGRGVYSQNKLNRINAHMIKHVKKAGGRIQQSFYCTHRPDAGCDCRKPGIGMVKQALGSVNKTIQSAKSSFFVGDTQKDIQAGYKSGCQTILVESGRENRRHTRRWLIKPDFIVKDLNTALNIIL